MGNRVVDVNTLQKFSDAYNNLKAEGFMPTAIAEKIMEAMDCKKTKYYAYLRECRESGLITDSYKENMEKKRQREAKMKDKDITQCDKCLETVEEQITTAHQVTACTECDPDCTCACECNDTPVAAPSPIYVPVKQVQKNSGGLAGFFKRLFGRK